MNNATLMYLIKMIFRPKDQLSRLTLGLLRIGMAGLVGGWAVNLVFSEAFLKKNINIIDGLTFTYQKCSDLALVFGVLFCDCWVYFVVYMCLCCSERFE